MMIELNPKIGHAFSIREIIRNQDRPTHCAFLPYTLRVLIQLDLPNALKPFQLNDTDRYNFQAVFLILFLNQSTTNYSQVHSKIDEIMAHHQTLTLQDCIKLIEKVYEQYKKLQQQASQHQTNLDFASVAPINLLGLMLVALMEQNQITMKTMSPLLSSSSRAGLMLQLKSYRMSRQWRLTPEDDGLYGMRERETIVTLPELDHIRCANFFSEHPVLASSVPAKRMQKLVRQLTQQAITLDDCLVFNMVAPVTDTRGELIVSGSRSDNPEQIAHIHMTHGLLYAGGGWVIMIPAPKHSDQDTAARFEILALSNSCGTLQVAFQDMRQAMCLVSPEIYLAQDKHDDTPLDSPDFPEVLANTSNTEDNLLTEAESQTKQLERSLVASNLEESAEHHRDLIERILKLQATTYQRHSPTDDVSEELVASPARRLRRVVATESAPPASPISNNRHRFIQTPTDQEEPEIFTTPPTTPAAMRKK